MRLFPIIALALFVSLVAYAEEEVGADPVLEDEDAAFLDELAFLAEESIIVSAAKHKQHIAESPSAITVITRDQIQNTHCTDLVCLLRHVPEVFVRELTPYYVSIGARALVDAFGNKALVLIDGREINLETIGLVNWQSLVVHLSDIERVEVIRGPGSALYGANAHSMVLSIFTRGVERDGVEVYLGGGEHNRTSTHLRAGYRLENWSFALSGGYETADHWRQRDTLEREVGRLRLRIDRESEQGKSVLQAGITSTQGTIYALMGYLDTHDGYLGYLCLSHETERIKAQFYSSLFSIDMFLDIPLEYRGIMLGRMPDNYDMFSSVVDSEVQANFEPFEGNLLIAGGNYRWITFMSDANNPSTVNQHRLGAFIHDEQKIGDNLLLTGGIRFDYNNITPFSVSPRAAAVWRFTREQLLRLSFGRAFRKPAFFETSIHIKGVQSEPGFEEIEDLFLETIGNDELGNESITSFELGYRGSFLEGSLLFEGGAFFHLYRDTISFATDIETNLGLPDLSRSSLRFQNTGHEVNTLGGSVSVTFHPLKEWRANLNYTYKYSYYVSEPRGDDYRQDEGKGKPVIWEPAHTLNASLHYAPEQGLRGGAALHFRSDAEQGIALSGSIFDPRVLLPVPSAAYLSGFLAWRIPFGQRYFEAGIKVLNILNQGYRDHVAVIRTDGEELGGELVGRRFYFFLRGTI